MTGVKANYCHLFHGMFGDKHDCGNLVLCQFRIHTSPKRMAFPYVPSPKSPDSPSLQGSRSVSRKAESLVASESARLGTIRAAACRSLPYYTIPHGWILTTNCPAATLWLFSSTLNSTHMAPVSLPAAWLNHPTCHTTLSLNPDLELPTWPPMQLLPYWATFASFSNRLHSFGCHL